MRHIKEVEDLAQNALFDSATLDSCSWWVTDLTDSARRELDENWQGIFRRSLLKLMPATQLGGHFHASFGPTKELHSMAALVFIMEFKNWTLDDAVDAYIFNNGIHFALNLPNRHNYLCTRTLEEYRRLVREDEAAGEVFLQVTRTQVAALGISVARQRLDSTHLLSDMASFGRTKLLAVAVKRLLTALKRHCTESYEALPAGLRERYETTLGRLFGEASTSKEGRASAQLQVAQDMHQLIETFADDVSIHARSTYQDLVRLFAEHCEIQDRQKTRSNCKPKNLRQAAARRRLGAAGDPAPTSQKPRKRRSSATRRDASASRAKNGARSIEGEPGSKASIEG